MDNTYETFKHFKQALAGSQLQEIDGVCEALYDLYGDSGRHLHPAQVMAKAIECYDIPFKGSSPDGKLHWQIGTHLGLPQVFIDIGTKEQLHRFGTMMPFEAPRIEHDFHNWLSDSPAHRFITSKPPHIQKMLFETITSDCINFGVCQEDKLKLQMSNEWSRHLFQASKDGQLDVVRDILNVGINPNRFDGRGNTALHYAASYGHEELIGVLVDAGAKVNARNDHGQTPLHLATSNARSDACLALMAHNANPNLPDGEGHTSIDIASIRMQRAKVRERVYEHAR